MKKRYIVGLVAVLTFFLVAFFPLAWVGKAALHPNGPQSLKFSGSIWSGTISGISQIGPIELKTSPAGLMTGKRAINFQSIAPYLTVSGAVGLSREGAVHAEGHIRGIGSIDYRFVGMDGGYTLDIPDIKFDKACISATGTFTSDVLQRNGKLLSWTGPELSGPVSCDNGDVVFNISGQDNMQDIDAVLRVGMAGGYQIEVDIKTLDSRADTVLPLFGFQKVGETYRMHEAGRWY